MIMFDKTDLRTNKWASRCMDNGGKIIARGKGVEWNTRKLTRGESGQNEKIKTSEIDIESLLLLCCGVLVLGLAITSIIFNILK